ncbi:MAG: ABC transporter permease [Prevotella sp.]|jgi:ABC-2 type transport system permease protein|nr:ABC transporter permease [Prevotella sp.]
MSIFRKYKEHLTDVLYIWREELKQVIKDEGVLMFLVIVPLGYPLLYSWIYNNESLHETPVVVVDQSHSALSRQFINDCDASSDVHIAYYAEDLDEARSLVSRQLVRGIYFIPSDFATRVSRGEQGTISVYCDMSLMLAYKAVYQTAMVEAGRLGAGLNIKKSGNYTKREDAITAQPLAVDDVTMFNPSGGYGSCVLPAVLMLILQQAIALGIGMAAGTARERNRNGQLIPTDDPHYRGAYRIVWGKALCYGMIGAVAAAYLSMAVPCMFSFPQLANGWTLLAMLLPYTMASVFFGMTVSCLVRYRENVMLLMVFVSVPLLFLTGVSWPQSSIPGAWQGVSWLFPSTFGVRAFIRINSMGATVSQILPEIRILWIQAAIYLSMACLVYRYQFRLARKYANNE